MSDQLDLHTGRNPWYVIHCKPMQERHAEAALRESLGVDTYLPTVVSHVRGQLKEVPFFPGYLFVSADLREVRLSSINFTHGVLRVLNFGDGPQEVPQLVVSTIKNRLEALNSEGGMPAHNFHPGDAVWLKSGPFKGLQAVFLGPMTPTARVKVLLEFLGRLNEVKVDVDALEQAHVQDIPKARGERRTRGKGRPIRAAEGVQVPGQPGPSTG